VNLIKLHGILNIYNLIIVKGLTQSVVVNVVKHLASYVLGSNLFGLGALVYIDGFNRDDIHKYDEASLEFSARFSLY
jgi:hypothetical protein